MHSKKHSEEALLVVGPAFEELTEEEAEMDGGFFSLLSGARGLNTSVNYAEIIAAGGEAGKSILEGLAFAFQGAALLVAAYKNPAS